MAWSNVDNLKALLGTMRVPFLLLTPACMAVGVGTAYQQVGELDSLSVWLVFIGALAAHISVNVFNEYFDFKSGLDSKTERTPFSGGSGSLPMNPQAARLSWWFAWLTLLISASVGIYFVIEQGFGLLPLGLVGLFLVVTYTTWWVYHPLLCLLAPGLGFGILMVLGTHYALTGAFSFQSLWAALVPTLLVTNLLLLNQFPDVEADKSIGRSHLPITLGLKACSRLFGVFYSLAFLVVVLGVAFSLLPVASLLALITVFMAWRSYVGAKLYAQDIPALIPAMKLNVVVNLLTPVFLAVGLFIG